jgi:hypothetical protein
VASGEGRCCFSYSPRVVAVVRRVQLRHSVTQAGFIPFIEKWEGGDGSQSSIYIIVKLYHALIQPLQYMYRNLDYQPTY